VDFAAVCTVTNRGGAGPQFWGSSSGKAVLQAHDGAWQSLLHETLHVDLANFDRLKERLAAPDVAAELAATALNVAFGSQDGDATVHDPVAGDWPTVRALIARVNGAPAYGELLRSLNTNKVMVTPSDPAVCRAYW
jgi:hypothetical protein